MSAPSASGRVNTGVATVESTPSTRAGRVRDLGDGRDVGDGPQRIGRRLDPHQPGLCRPDRGAHRREVGRVDELDPMAEARRLGREPVAERPVHDLRRDDVRWPGGSASTTAVAADMPEPNSSASSAPSSAAITRLGLAHRRVVGPAVDVAGAVLVVGVADVGGRNVHRRHHRPGGGLDRPERLRGDGAGLRSRSCSAHGRITAEHGRVVKPPGGGVLPVTSTD